MLLRNNKKKLFYERTDRRKTQNYSSETHNMNFYGLK